MMSGEGVEGNDGLRVPDTLNGVDLLIDEVANITVVGDIEFGHQIKFARNRIAFRGLFNPLDEGVGDTVGFAEFTFYKNEKRS